jgi:GT2 family glycosyltransferase
MHTVRGPAFRVKPYAHSKYKFVVRAKLGGKWKRSYFRSEAEAVAYADKQNASLEMQVNQKRSGSMRSAGDTTRTRNWDESERSNGRSNISAGAVSRKAIVVLGMHRSGTSALCGALNILGVDFGRRLAPATKDNQKGHWEHHEIVSLHDQLLGSLGSRWDDDRPLPADWVKRDVAQDTRSLLIGILKRDFADTPVFGLKDPRICRLIPLWLPIFQTLRIEPRFILMIRHPWEVAESLAKRDGLEHPKSYLLWLEHLVQAVSATSAHQQSVVCYEELINDPVKVLTGLRNELRVNFRVPSSVGTSLREFLEPSLRHHDFKKGETDKRDSSVPHLALDLYEAIRNASTSIEIGEKTAALIAQFSRSSELFYPRVNLVETELDSLDKEIAKSEGSVTDEGLVRLQVFHPLAEGYREAESQTRYFASGSWKRLVIDLPGKKHNRDRPVRIDPVSYAAVVDIAEIALKRHTTGEILWAATGSTDFAALTVGGTACRLAHERYLRILSFGSDPQLLLPPSTTALATSPLRLELLVLVDANPESIRTALEIAQEDLLRRDATIAAKDAEFQQLSAKIEQISATRDAEFQHLSTKIEQISDAGDAEFQHLSAKIEQISATIARSEQELLQRDATIAAKEAELFAKSSETADLADKLGKLNQDVKSLADLFGLTRQGLQDSDSQAAALIHSLFRDIRRIHKRRLVWKAGRLWRRAFSREGAQDIPPKPRITAEALKKNLQGIQRTLKSKKTSPAIALKSLTELVVLQSRVHEALASLRLGSLLRPQQRIIGAREQVSFPAESKFSALFDPQWYLDQNPEVKETGMDPLQHYLRYGARMGRDPHPLFETKWYLNQKPELTNIALSPLEHYVSYGAREGRSPHPDFDAQSYVKSHPESVIGEMTPLAHYLTVGWKLGYRPNPSFDPQFYLRTYPDVLAANVEPLTHFVLHGRTEGRKTAEEGISFEPYQPDFDIPREPIGTANLCSAPPVKAIAFYLPQFHPIPENDAWWGEGFTEWNNVRSGEPNFPGHYQPHVPTGLGYYDLRETQVLQKQAELAKRSGIFGFCFYYYWFAGKVLLGLPIRRMLESGKPNFPFCICWANENWTRRWDGRDNEVLIAQRHSPEDDINLIRHLENVLLAPNYIRVGGKPLLLVYRPALLPDAHETTERWRNYFRSNGHGELHLVMVRSFHDQTATEIYGFDAAAQFPPHFPAATITPSIAGNDKKFKGTIYDYTDLRRLALEQLIAASNAEKTYPTVMPSWDNTARRGSDAVIWANSSPESYYEWLSAAVEHVKNKEQPDERLIFINAWNEWAEGCHLEPDEKYGQAWLNATAFALRPSEVPLSYTSLVQSHPEPPRIETIKVPALPDRVRLFISVLFYYREDLVEWFLRSIGKQILRAESRGDIECSLSLSFNYQPDAAVIAQVRQIIATISHPRADAVHIVENGFNVGFGAGHNRVFDKFDSDIFLIMNSDVRVIDEDWLIKLVDRFRGSDAAIIGLSETASRLRGDGCGVPVKDRGEEFDFVDGSALAIRSDIARRFGLFSPSYDYFYFEDVDLCLRYRQMGLRIGLLDAPYEHERSSSSRLLPQFAVENVLDRNRGRFFEKWGKYLRTRTLSNRIGVRFLDTDRQTQCASLPGIINLLREHKTAVIDLWGVHEQLADFFQHPRIRLIPSWQTLRENDYARYYDLATTGSGVPRVHDIANRLGCTPDFLGARAHLESLSKSRRGEDVTPPKRAMLYIARKSPLFDGREPDVESFAVVAKMLCEKNFEISLYTEYGTFETQTIDGFAGPDWKHAALCSGIELLKEISASELLITSDNWISELGQLLQKRTFLWLGGTSGRAAIWDFERASFFADQSLRCLGCYHQFGRNHHNVCLRGDIACMRPQLARDFLACLKTFLDGTPLKAATVYSNHSDLTSRRTMPSTELSLEHWPRNAANSVLVLTPAHSQLQRRVLDRAKELADRALKGMRKCRVIHGSSSEAPVRGQPHPHRQAAMASLRQSMVERYLQDERWIFWVDADIIDYPALLIERLIQRAEGGVAAPLVLMEGEITEPVNKDGFGPGRFYDIAGFVENSRWARFTPPYFDQLGPVYHLDSVGSCYLINADLYRMGATHTIDPASQNFLVRGEAWSGEAIRRNQRGPANAFTEHFSVCQFAFRHGLPVRAFADLVAFHQRV